MSHTHEIRSDSAQTAGSTVPSDLPRFSQRKVTNEATPAKKKFGTDLTYSSRVLDFEQVRAQLAREMDGHWVGPMPVEQFFTEFLRPANGLPDLPHIPEDPFKDVPSKGVEAARYTPFITAIEGWMPHLKAVNTSTKEDTVNKLRLKTDISIYQPVEGVQIPDRTDFSQMELWIEFKRKTEGVAFEDPKRLGPDGEHPSTPEDVPFTPDTQDGIYARGQLAHYAGAMDSKQFRNFSFSILIEGNDARFLRWDTSGTIVSAAFDYRENPRLMAEFLWRFDHLSAKERGHDTSVEPAELPAEVEARIRKKLNVEDGVPLYRYSVPGLIERGYACGPRLPTHNRSIISRRTRSSPLIWIPAGDVGVCATDGQSSSKEAGNSATDEEGGTKKEPWDEETMIYMKDTWRFLSDLPGVVVLPEREVYVTLHEHRTPNIPEHVEGGDIDGGRTRTQEFANAPWLGMKARITAHQHYRLVHAVVGRALIKFGCTKQLVTAVLDALKAHSHAYENAKILHRDISVGNIILTDEGRGLLIDWEMAKKVDETGSRRPDRTGTWQFMSAQLLRNPGKLHTFEDDLESFLHVLGWTTLRYVPAIDKYLPGIRGADMEAFDEHHEEDGYGEHGGSRKCNVLCSGQYPSESKRFQPRKPTPLWDILTDLSAPFKSLYSTKPPTDEDRRKTRLPLDVSDWNLVRVAVAVQEYDENMKRLKSSSWFIEQMSNALDDQEWPTDDKAEFLPIVYPGETEFQNKLKNNRLRDSQGVLESAKGIQGSAKRPASPNPDSERPSKRLRSTFAISGPRS